jgi:hypothetical protein
VGTEECDDEDDRETRVVVLADAVVETVRLGTARGDSEEDDDENTVGLAVSERDCDALRVALKPNCVEDCNVLRVPLREEVRDVDVVTEGDVVRVRDGDSETVVLGDTERAKLLFTDARDVDAVIDGVTDRTVVTLTDVQSRVIARMRLFV